MSNAMVLRRLLYTFKRQWGKEFNYVQIIKDEADTRTGSRNIIREAFVLPGVLLPGTTFRKFIQDIGYLAADKNFTYGGLEDFNKLTLIFDINDLPSGFNIDLDGYINYGGKRYDRQSFTNMYEVAFIMVAQGVEGANPYAVLKNGVESSLQVQQRAACELN